MSVFFICVSILSFCLKTHPNLRVPVIRNVTVDFTRPLAMMDAAMATAGSGGRQYGHHHGHQYGRAMTTGNWSSWTLDKTRTEPHQAFFFVELVKL